MATACVNQIKINRKRDREKQTVNVQKRCQLKESCQFVLNKVRNTWKTHTKIVYNIQAKHAKNCSK